MIKIFSDKTPRLRHFFCLGVTAFCFVWMITPMLLLQGGYCFSIDDGLDSYGGIVQFIHDHHLYFHLNQNLPIMNGIEGKYTFIGFTLYDFYNCMFGYVVGQTLTRITGCFLGFFSFKHLIEYLYPKRTPFFNDMTLLIASIYIVTPVSSLRVIAFASLPMVIETFLRLRNKALLSKMCFFSVIFPVLSVFDGVFLFVLGFWLLFTVVDAVISKKINRNLCIAFVIMCIITVAVNYNFFLVASAAGETTRGIYVDRLKEFAFNKDLFKDYLFNGQYHATAYPGRFLWPFNAIVSLVICGMILENNNILRSEAKSVFIVGFGWLLCFMGALIMAAQESGFRVGILLIDGFQWGRVIALTTFMWPLMIIASMYILREKKFSNFLFLAIICLQLAHVALVDSQYNDTWTTIRNEISYIRNRTKPYISYNEFVSKKLFDEIKADIGYDWQGVAAYGYHPAVLLFNDFNTIDGYFTVHSMKWQQQFREIIAPTLNAMGDYKSYYDEWGGRMYLYGAMGFGATKTKDREPTDIFINANAYKKYGGEYILSAVKIPNADEQGLEFIKDYDNQKSIYHIWLYRAK